MAEKLTHAVTVKLGERSLTGAHAIAASRGMEISEYIRDLLDQDRLRAQAQYDALKAIFEADEQAGKRNAG